MMSIGQLLLAVYCLLVGLVCAALFGWGVWWRIIEPRDGAMFAILPLVSALALAYGIRTLRAGRASASGQTPDQPPSPDGGRPPAEASPTDAAAPERTRARNRRRRTSLPRPRA
jgi:hypothetical protein